MNQTKQQEQGSAVAEPGVRKGWELFWRIVAGLILLVIAWVAWVAYQIMPRSVVTPLAYASPVRPISMQPASSDAQTPAVPPAGESAAAPPAAAEAAAPNPVQGGVPTVAAQAPAGGPAATVESKELPVKAEGLRLATEISTLPVDKGIARTQESKPGAVATPPAAARAAGRDRP